MNEDWLKDIHDRLANYEVEEPTGLWTDLRERLPLASTVAQGRVSKRRFALWATGAAMATAAAVALFFLLGTAAEDARPDFVASSAHSAKSQTASGTSSASGKAQLTAKPAPQGTTAIAATSEHVANSEVLLASAKGVEAQKETTESSEIAENNGLEAGAPTSTPTTANGNSGKASPHADMTASHKELALFSPRESQTTRTSRFAIGVFGAGGIPSSQVDNIQSLVSGSMSDPMNSETDIPVLDIIEDKQETDTKPVTKHKRPIRFGLLLAYRLSDRLSLETGVSYTRLTSDLLYGSSDYHYSGQQTLHYVGIPLALRTNVFSFHKFDTYFSANAEASVRIAGRMVYDYVLDSTPWENGAVHIKSHPIQCSIGVAIGAQYNFSHAVAVYAEPALNYYFDDHSAVETIYKEKPLSFGLNLGLRFSIDKK